jgi:predicted esterase
MAMTFTYLINRGLDLYREGRFQEGYHLMTEHADHMPRNDAQMYDFRASLACRAGWPEVGLRLLTEAVMDKGCWYAQGYLSDDDDIRPATQLPGFQELKDVCAIREAEARRNVRREALMVNSEQDERLPLIIVLHGNMQNTAIAQEDWLGAEREYDLVFLQSTQLSFSDAYEWDDLDKSLADLGDYLEELRGKGHLDRREVILAGFSAGARVALWAVFNGLIKPQAMVLVGPWLPEISEWSDRVITLGGNLPVTCIVCGSRDEDCLPGARALHTALVDAHVPTVMEEVEGLDHDYPPGFGEGVGRMVRSVQTP